MNGSKSLEQIGADGIQILGHVCEGQQLINYEGMHNQRGYGGQEGEWLSQEYLLATGAVDLFMFDYTVRFQQCLFMLNASETKLLSTHPVIQLQGTENIGLQPEKMKEQAEKL
jgi:carbon-monoxide dehydrogenase catalytic subunit